VFAACWTRVEGLALWGTLGLCYLFRGNLFGAFVVGLAVLAPISLLCFHQWMFNDWKAYFNHNLDQIKILGWPPFLQVTSSGEYISDIYEHLGTMVVFPVLVVGTALLFPTCVPLGIFGTVYVIYVIYVIYVSILRHADVYRYSLPAYIFAVIVGLNDVWSSRTFRLPAFIIVPAYLAMAACYCDGQLAPNSAPNHFMKDVIGRH
jgi:hypothetical protein